MNLLSPSLQSKIRANPTQTNIRSDHDEIDQNHVKIIKSVDTHRKLIKIPDSFNGRKVWEGLLIPPKNQGSCGSCWAFASVGTLADKFNIQSMGLIHVDLSAAKIILCGRGIETAEYDPELTAQEEEKTLLTSACYGDTLYNAWEYLYLIGTTTEQCVPYDKQYGRFKGLSSLGSFTIPERMPVCSQVTGKLGDMCSNFIFDRNSSNEYGDPARFYRNKHFYAIAGTEKDGGSEFNIRSEIYNWGPVSTGMKVYPDFYTFDAKNTIYEWNGKGPQVGGHAIEIVGWGFQDGTPYWSIKNSWGPEWGDGGYFKMVRGKNNCEIEENVITGIPDFFYPPDRKKLINYSWAEDEETVQLRRQYTTRLGYISGGIDPTTGYTRRIVTTMPWINFSRPIPLSDLPDFQKWVAGIDGRAQNRVVYRAVINSRTKDIRYGNQTIKTVFIVLLLLISLLILVGIFRLRH